MSDAITPNLGLTKPEVGGSDDMWGEKLNANFDLIDAAITPGGVTKAYVDTQDALRVLKAGDTMTGPLTLTFANPAITLNSNDISQRPVFNFSRSGVIRWQWHMSENLNHFFLSRRDTSGVEIDRPFSVDVNTGTVAIINSPTNALHAANKGYVDNAVATKEPTIAAGTTAQYWRGDKTFQTLDKVAVGLGNVDNTSDANKPVSTATQTALNLKANLASPAFTGNPTAPTPTPGDNDTSIATTAFVTAAVTAAGGVTPSNNNPIMDGVAAPGTSALYSREDHIHPSDTSRQPFITAGTTAQYWRGDKTFQTLDKAAVGLGNVDNTSDANKPVSTAQAAADALRVLKSGDTMSGHLVLPTGPAASNATRKDYVDAADALKVSKTGDTMTGMLTMSGATAIINAPQKGNVLGAIGGTAYNGAVQSTDAGVLFYGAGGNWSGFGTDNNGHFWLRVGLSGSPVPQLRVNASTLQVETQNTARKFVVFTSGSGTYAPTVGCIAIRARLAGGGAGGQGGGTTHGTGGAGGTTSLGPFSATGGNSIAPGTGSGGQINLTGGQGTYPSGAAQEYTGAVGATTVFGGAGGGVGFNNAGSAGAPNTGAGGAGGGCDGAVAGATGGAGGGAGGYCEAIAAPPAASYAYVVGTGGAGGGNGVSGKLGGNGGSGIIIIEEFFL